jgi:hypothetical protein
MPRGKKFSARCSIDKILIPICAQLIPTGRRKLMIRSDVSQCHNAKVMPDFMSQKQSKFAPHPQYSPDLAPSDFFLFSYLKGELRGSFFQTSDELLNPMCGLLHDISLRCHLMFPTNGLTVVNKSSQQKGTTLSKQYMHTFLSSNSAQLESSYT